MKLCCGINNCCFFLSSVNCRFYSCEWSSNSNSVHKSSYKTLIGGLRFQNLVFVFLYYGNKLKKLWNILGFSRDVDVFCH